MGPVTSTLPCRWDYETKAGMYHAMSVPVRATQKSVPKSPCRSVPEIPPKNLCQSMAPGSVPGPLGGPLGSPGGSLGGPTGSVVRLIGTPALMTRSRRSTSWSSALESWGAEKAPKPKSSKK